MVSLFGTGDKVALNVLIVVVAVAIAALAGVDRVAVVHGRRRDLRRVRRRRRDRRGAQPARLDDVRGPQRVRRRRRGARRPGPAVQHAAGHGARRRVRRRVTRPPCLAHDAAAGRRRGPAVARLAAPPLPRRERGDARRASWSPVPWAARSWTAAPGGDRHDVEAARRSRVRAGRRAPGRRDTGSRRPPPPSRP